MAGRGLYGQQQTEIFVGAAFGRPRAPEGRPYGWRNLVERGPPGAPSVPSPWGEGGPKGRMRGRRAGRFRSTESPSHRLAAVTAPFHKGARAFALPVIPRPRRGRGNPFLFGRRDGLPRRACGPPRNDESWTGILVGRDHWARRGPPGRRALRNTHHVGRGPPGAPPASLPPTGGEVARRAG